MAITRRTTSDPLGYIRDDLLLNMQLLEIHLGACNGSLADAAKAESLIEIIEQIYKPLETLRRQDALLVFDAMRTAVQDRAHNAPEKLALMQQAMQQLHRYMETCLTPGSQQGAGDALLKMATTLRQLCQADSQTEVSGFSKLRELLGRLHSTLSTQVEPAADQTQPWQAFQTDLALLQKLAVAHGWEQSGAILVRLQRIVHALANGAAADYGMLVSVVCAETLAGLRYTLQSPETDTPAVMAVLHRADQHLREVDALLRDLPSTVTSAPSSTATSMASATPVSKPNSTASRTAPPLLDFPELIDLPLSPAKPPRNNNQEDLPTVVSFQTADMPERVTMDLSRRAISTLSNCSLASDLEAGLIMPDPSAASAACDLEKLIQIIGLSEADPEFTEVFLEEAQNELATIERELAAWRNDSSNQQAVTTIRRAFHTLKGSGRMVGTMIIGDFAWTLENLLNQVLEGKLPACPEIVEAITAATAALAPLVGKVPLHGSEVERLTVLTAQTNALVERLLVQPPVLETAVSAVAALQLFAADADAEFVEVFIEEAHGQLAVMQQQLEVWRDNFEDRQAINALRRAFHTIKGSGRVVGAQEIGDFSWHFEELLNQVLNGALPASTALAMLLSEAVSALENLLGADTAAAQAALQQLPRITARATDFAQQATAPTITAPAPLATEPVSVRATPASLLASLAPATIPTALLEPSSAESLALSAADQELVQAFQDEAAEILDASDLLLQRLADEPDNVELLNDLRRGLHTLKGSSRMAGIMTFGDLAHAAESVLEGLGKGNAQTSVNPQLLDTLQQALDHLNKMLAAAGVGVTPASADDLIADLHRLADTVDAAPQPTAALVETPLLHVETEGATESSTFQSMTELDQELVQIFQVEAHEILDSSDTLLQKLRDEPESAELLNNLRREMHTLKGSSRMAGFMTVGDVAHAAESILDALGKGALHMDSAVLSQVQGAMDSLHQMLEDIKQGERLAPLPALIEQLHGVLGEKVAEAPHAATTAMPRKTTPAAPALEPKIAPSATLPSAAAPDAIRVSATLLNTLVNQMGESSIFRSRIDQGVNAMSNNLNDLDQTIARFRRQVSQLATQAEARIQSRHDQDTKAHEQDFDPLELDRFTELQQLSRSLMEIADDLGNIGTTLSEHSRDITNLLDQQGKVNKEIQQGLMRTGMVRFGSITPRLRRVVRQAAQDLGKRAELLVSGEDTEVDRTVLENIVAPLEHMLRNSLAHGIEAPERRREAGKSEIGTITLSLRREGAELVVELNDDGAGLNFAAIRAKGEEKGFLLPDQEVSSEELIALLMRPGFSTATAVTQVSGRGVGMDVVSEAIRAMRGALLIETEQGQGTRFIIRLPFSLAVTQALLVQAGQGLFAIPLLSIEVVTRLQEQQFRAYLTGEAVLHQYGERDYPVHNLGILVGSEWIVPFEEAKDRKPPTLLFRSAEALAALQVEAVLGNQEIIVKPISPQFNAVPGLSGATVLGDGRVVVVLELAALVRNINTQRQKQQESRALRAARQEARQDKLTIMVIDDSITMRKVTARILERHNIKAITAKDGLDAVAMLQTQVPDLAILDIEMPRMDGFEVVAHVRNQSTLRHLPIIMVTSRGGDKHRERAMLLGVNDYLTKPYQEEQLMNSIRNILGERAADLIT